MPKQVHNDNAASRSMESLAVAMDDGTKYYEAAEPGYRGAFTRDTLIAMSLRGDPHLLESQIDFSARYIGQVMDIMSGEEPGKVHHELPGSIGRYGRLTTYNACDTTAEFLRSIAALYEHGYTSVITKYAALIQSALGYIKHHIDERYLFIEDPKFAGDKRADGFRRQFALKVTYWKDSELNRAGRKEPNYPIVYTLAHFQNAQAIKRIGLALRDKDLVSLAESMKHAGLKNLWQGDHFITAIDGDGVIDPPSSDSLMSLLYLSPDELRPGYAESIEKYMAELETAAGYRSGLPVSKNTDPYHVKIWTHEQALLNAAAKRHGLTKSESITRRVEPYFLVEDDIFPELIDPDTLDIDGNVKQLWSIGAYLYFRNPKRCLL